MAGTTDRVSGSASYDNLIAALATARLSVQMSQRGLSSKLGKAPTFVSKIERGERMLGIVELFQVCGALGVDALTLLNDTFGKVKADG